MKASDNQATRARIEKAISEMHDAGCKMTISGVAKEAGVSNAAIHNRYPDLAVKIRDLVSRAAEQNSRRALIRKTGKFKTARQRRQALLDELDKIKKEFAGLNSVNCSLDLENQTLKVEIKELKRQLAEALKLKHLSKV